MAAQKLYSSLAVLVASGTWAGCVSAPDGTGSSPIAVKAFALSACSGANDDPNKDVTAIQVVVRHDDDDPATPEITYDARFGKLGDSGQVSAPNVPEGVDEEVSVIGHAGDKPAWFGRKKHMVIQQGQDNKARLVLSRLGAASCPKDPSNEYTHRVFATVTPLGQAGSRYYLVTGGLTTVNTTGKISLTTSDSSRKAFIYDSETGTMAKVASLMAVGRGAHGAAFVPACRKVEEGEGDAKVEKLLSCVVLFGGTAKMTFDGASGTGFGWAFETSDALSSIEVFEFDPVSPADGAFSSAAAGQTMLEKRVFPTANVISNDGLVLVCGGGQWGTTSKKPEYKECDVFDAGADTKTTWTFIPSNNLMNLYRTGMASAAYQTGAETKLLFYGGGTEGEVAETFVSSTAQREGTGGTFRKRDIGGPPHSFFHSLTPIAPERFKDGRVVHRFVLIGGVNWEGKAFFPPKAENAYIIKVDDSTAEGTVTADALGGLGIGRYFHVAQTVGGDRFAVLGGFTDQVGDGLPGVTADARHLTWQLADKGGENERFVPKALVSPGESVVPGESGIAARGGMASVALDNDTIIIAGGIDATADLSTDQAGAIEVYTPSTVLALPVEQ